MNKKASVMDVLLITVIFFTFGVGLFIVYFAYDTTVTKMENITVMNTTNVYNVLENSKSNVGDRLDYVMFAIFMGMAIALIITSFLVNFHTIFIWIITLIDIIIVVVAAILSFTWNELSNMPIFGTFASSKFPIMSHMLDNFPLYVSIVALLSLAIMYMKPYLMGESA